MSHPSVPARLLQALLHIHNSIPKLIASPSVGSAGPDAQRRASVAIIIRLRPASTPATSANTSASSSPLAAPHAALFTSPPPTPSLPSPPSIPSQLNDFFAQPWVNDPTTTAEMLFIKRASRASDRWSAHIAFPGGRSEPEDEDEKYTAMRETWEEVGLDLAEKEWISVGQLDDREITTSLGKRLLMILSPFVFLHTSPYAPVPELQESEVASAHWIPLELLHAPQARYGVVGIDISSRLAPRSPLARFALKLLVGSMHFRCVLLPNDPVAVGLLPSQLDVDPLAPRPDLKLWGLTLGMTLDLLSCMSLPRSSTSKLLPSTSSIPPIPAGFEEELPSAPAAALAAVSPTLAMSPLAPSMASIFPRFSHPDINLLIWIFGFRYRRLLSHSKLPPSTSSIAGAGGETRDVRVNWAGMALGSYYSAVRRALVVAVVLRALTALGAGAVGGWWLNKRIKEWRLRQTLA